MNFEQLKIITTISEEKNFSRTATRLNMTTSAISQSVSNIEKELRVKIFNRSKSGTFATEKGLFIISKAYRLLEIQDEIFKYTHDKENKKLKIKIGISPGINFLLTHVLKKLKENYEFLEVSIEELDTQILLKELSKKKYNFAIIAFSNNIKNHNLNYKIQKILDSTFCFIVNKKSHLSKNEYITYNDIIKENLTIFDDKFLKNYISHIETYCNQKANIFIKSNNVNFILNAINENMAIALVPKYLIYNNFYKTPDKFKILNIKEKDVIINPSLWFLELTDLAGDTFSKDFFNFLSQYSIK